MGDMEKGHKGKLTIVMLGPSLKATSGISGIVNTWLAYGFSERVDLRYIQTLKFYVPGRRFRKLLEAIRAFGFLFIHLLIRRPDLVHIHVSSYRSFHRKRLLSTLARLFRVPYLVHVHSGAFERFIREKPRNAVLVEKMLDRACAVIVLSESWLGVLKKYISNPNVYVLYNSASQKDLLTASPALRPGRIIVLFLGRLTREKGVYDLLDVIPRVVENQPNVLFRLGGDGDLQRVETIVKERNLNEYVEILGWVSGDVKHSHYRSAEIYTLPSYTEGLPGTLLEAMACGLPVVTTDVGGIPEAVFEGKNGYLIKPGDRSNLTEKLVRLCENEGIRRRMGEASLEVYHNRFATEKILNELLTIYNEINEKTLKDF